jgi:hypothetical protein
MTWAYMKFSPGSRPSTWVYQNEAVVTTTATKNTTVAISVLSGRMFSHQ